MRTSEPAIVQRADTYERAPRGETARRAPGPGALDAGIVIALVVGPLALLVSRLAPSLSAPSVAAALLSLVAGGVALGSLPEAAVDPAENAALVRRRRIALAVIVVALVSMFLIARSAG
jgi:hypothetical protein